MLTFSGCKNIAAGSYPFVEKYVIDTNEAAVIKAVTILKTSHPSLVVPAYLINGHREPSDLLYHIYFNLPEDHIIVYCWTRAESKNKTAFGFVAINEGTGIGNWREINKDFTSSANKKYLEIFQRRLLEPINLILKNKNGL